MKESMIVDGNEEIWWSWKALKVMRWLGNFWKGQLRRWIKEFIRLKWGKIKSCVIKSLISFIKENIKRLKWIAIALIDWFLMINLKKQKYSSWSFEKTKHGDQKNCLIP